MRWLIFALFLSGCAFSLNEVNTGVSVGRTFDDGAVFAAGRTAWGVNVSGRWGRK